MMPSKDTLEFIGKLIAFLVFVFSVGKYWWDLRIDRDMERLKRSDAYVAEYISNGIREHETKIDLRLLWHRKLFGDINSAQRVNDEQFVAIAHELLFAYDESKDRQIENARAYLPDFLEVADFYARINSCMVAEICHGAVVQEFFCDRATRFARRNARMIAYYERYSESKEWSNGLESLVVRCQAPLS